MRKMPGEWLHKANCPGSGVEGETRPQCSAHYTTGTCLPSLMPPSLLPSPPESSSVIPPYKYKVTTQPGTPHPCVSCPITQQPSPAFSSGRTSSLNLLGEQTTISWLSGSTRHHHAEEKPRGYETAPKGAMEKPRALELIQRFGAGGRLCDLHPGQAESGLFCGSGVSARRLSSQSHGVDAGLISLNNRPRSRCGEACGQGSGESCGRSDPRRMGGLGRGSERRSSRSAAHPSWTRLALGPRKRGPWAGICCRPSFHPLIKSTQA